jgi:predicted nucleic acid-binding protein
MIMSKIAVDTNVLLYFLDTSLPLRRKIAANIIAQQPIFNSQSLSELINVLNRRWKYPKTSIIKVVTGLLEECKFVSLHKQPFHFYQEFLNLIGRLKYVNGH